MAGGIRRHVGKHHVGRTTEQRLEPVGRLRIEKIEMQEFDARHRFHFEDIDRDHPAPALSRADALCRDLAPAAGRGAEIDHFARRA